MKTKYGIVALALLINSVLFAQKDELKLAEKAFKAANFTETKAALLKVEALLSNAYESQKAQFYFIKGNTAFELAKKKIGVGENLIEAAKSYNDLIEVEKKSGKSKYSALAQNSLIEIKRELTNSAITDNTDKKFKESALKLYQVYLLDKRDSIMLYYAAGSAINAEDNDLALEYYNKLKDINYSGKATNYTAKSKASDNEDIFPSIKDRDQAVKLGTHTNPKVEQITSKRGEIYKNIALIYVQKGDVSAAKKAVSDARKTNPDDTSLIITEADLYLKTNDISKYKELISEALAKNPTNADLFYNLGVITSQSKDANSKLEAEKHYKKAIEIKPDFKDAYMNLAVLKLEGDTAILDQMNKLTTSPADEKKYQILRVKRQELLKSALPYLEKAYELFLGDADIKTTLKNVYNALDMTDKMKALK